MKALARVLWARIECAVDGHWYEHVRNLHGDEINLWGGARSLWECQHCGKHIARAWLFNPLTKKINKELDED